MYHFPAKKILIFLVSIVLFFSCPVKTILGEEIRKIPLDKVKAIRISELLDKFKEQIPPRDELKRVMNTAKR